jgi:hypothetical protein
MAYTQRFLSWGAAPAAIALAVACGESSPSKPPAITISVSPSSVEVQVGESRRFEATVAGSVNRAVTWSVEEAMAEAWLTVDGPTAATFAPLAPGSFRIVASAAAKADEKATATVTVPQPAVAVAPAEVFGLAAGGAVQFGASVAGLPSDAVAWSVLEPGGGAIGQDGRYTAPGVEGTYHVLAASAADPGLWAVATVTVGRPR